MENSICLKCANSSTCPIDSSANVQHCGFFVEKPDYRKIINDYIDQIAERVADKVVERMKDEQKITLQVDGLQQHVESGQDHGYTEGVV